MYLYVSPSVILRGSSDAKSQGKVYDWERIVSIDSFR